MAKDAAGLATSVLMNAEALETDPTNPSNLLNARQNAQNAETSLLQLPAGTTQPQRDVAQHVSDAATEVLKTALARPAGDEKPKISAIDAVLVRYIGQVVPLPASALCWILENEQPKDLFSQTDGLTEQVNNLHGDAIAVFDRMNTWREDLIVTLRSVVTPPGGNAVLTVHIILHEAYAPFAFGTPPKKDAGADAAKGASGTITAAAATGSGQEQHEVRRVLIEVHRQADANLVGAIIGSTIPNRAFSLQPGPPGPLTPTTGSSGTATPVVPTTGLPAYYYGYENQNDHVQIQGMAEINFYPGGRDFFPGYLRGWRRVIPGLLFGTTVTAMGNFVGGLDFEPANGFDLILGGEAERFLESALPERVARRLDRRSRSAAARALS